jgi:predicted ester cyclase
MSIEQNKAIVRRYLDRVVSHGDPAVAEQVVAPGVVFTSPYTAEPARGREAFLAMITGLRSAFPDLSLAEHAVLGEGDLVATRWTASGTHTGGPFGGLAPTGRRFAITGMSMYRVADGRIVEGWVNDDSLAMLRQLGALPEAASA